MSPQLEKLTQNLEQLRKFVKACRCRRDLVNLDARRSFRLFDPKQSDQGFEALKAKGLVSG